MTQFIESEEKIAEFKECFNLYDRDNDGLISTDQMKLVIRSLGQCPSERELKEIQEKLGKTKVTFPEFLDLMWKMMQKSRNPEKDIHEGFRIYDTKNQGVVAIKDLRHIMTRTGEKLTQVEFEYMLKEAGVPKNASHVKYSDLARAFKKKRVEKSCKINGEGESFKKVDNNVKVDLHQRFFTAIVGK